MLARTYLLHLLKLSAAKEYALPQFWPIRVLLTIHEMPFNPLARHSAT